MALFDGELDGGDLLFGAAALFLLDDSRKQRARIDAESQAIRDADAAQAWANQHGMTFQLHQIIERGRSIHEARAWAAKIVGLTTVGQRIRRSTYTPSTPATATGTDLNDSPTPHSGTEVSVTFPRPRDAACEMVGLTGRRSARAEGTNGYG